MRRARKGRVLFSAMKRFLRFSIYLVMAFFLLVVLVLFPMACAAGHKMVLEQKDVQFFKVEEIRHQEPIILKISGLAFHSGMAMSSIKTREEGTSLLIFVSLTPAREGLSGSFNFEMPVPASVKDARFGNEKTVIWKRK